MASFERLSENSDKSLKAADMRFAAKQTFSCLCIKAELVLNTYQNFLTIFLLFFCFDEASIESIISSFKKRSKS